MESAIENYMWHVKDDYIYAFETIDRKGIPKELQGELEFTTDIPVNGFNIYHGSELKIVWQLYDHDRKQWQDGNQSPEITFKQFQNYFRTTRKIIRKK